METTKTSTCHTVAERALFQQSEPHDASASRACSYFTFTISTMPLCHTHGSKRGFFVVVVCCFFIIIIIHGTVLGVTYNDTEQIRVAFLIPFKNCNYAMGLLKELIDSTNPNIRNLLHYSIWWEVWITFGLLLNLVSEINGEPLWEIPLCTDARINGCLLDTIYNNVVRPLMQVNAILL